MSELEQQLWIQVFMRMLVEEHEALDVVANLADKAVSRMRKAPGGSRVQSAEQDGGSDG